MTVSLSLTPALVLAADRLGAEVARDGQRALARLLLAGPEAAAGTGRGERGEQRATARARLIRRGPRRGTRARCRPAVAVSASRAGRRHGHAAPRPPTPVVAGAGPSRTVAPATATPRPLSS